MWLSHDYHMTCSICSVVAATLDAPKTQYELDCIRPDFLLLRVSAELKSSVEDKTVSAFPNLSLLLVLRL